MAYFHWRALPLKTAQGICEAANAMRLQPVGLGLEVAQASSAQRRDHQDGIEVPGRRQLLVGRKHTLGLKPCPNVALASFEFAQGVGRVNGIDVQAEAVLSLQNGPGPHQ